MRSGRSVPAGPAMTPQASSGWSRRACATTASYRSWRSSNTQGRLRRGSAAEHGGDQRLLQLAEPVVEQVDGDPRVVRGQLVELLAPVLGDVEAGAEQQPHVVDGLHPGAHALVRVEHDGVGIGDVGEDLCERV